MWLGPAPLPGGAGLKLANSPSPNHGPRTGGGRPRLVVLHYTAMTDAQSAIAWLCNPESRVSAHYLIDRKGQATQLVSEDRRAWHAGLGSWGDFGDVNSQSIGIELCNTGAMPFAAAQMDALERLLSDIQSRYAIRPEGIIGHSDCAPHRKVDPGSRFDWARLARNGMARATPESKTSDQDDFVASMRRAGYTTADATEDQLLSALRLRHRPDARGPLDARDRAIAEGLAGQAVIDRAPADA